MPSNCTESVRVATATAADAERALAQHSQFGARWPALEDPLRDKVLALRDDPAALLARGVKLAEAGDVAGAISAHESALRANPSLIQAHANLISLYGRAGNFVKAEEEYRTVVALGGDLSEAHYDYGVLLSLQDKWDLAVDAYGKANLATGRATRADDLFRMYSMTKPITSVALLMLYEEGKFQLTDPLSLYFPAFADVRVYAGTGPAGGMLLGAPRRAITVQDVFRHTAGLTYGLFGATPVDKMYQDVDVLATDLSGLMQKLPKLPLAPWVLQSNWSCTVPTQSTSCSRMRRHAKVRLLVSCRLSRPSNQVPL